MTTLQSADVNLIGQSEDFEFAALNEAVNYRRTIVREFGRHLRGRVLEVGAGVGQTTRELMALPGIDELVGVEPDRRFHSGFREALPDVRLVEGTSDGVVGEDFDGIVTVNVAEHIEDDLAEFRAQHELLKSRGGKVCCLVPARPEIFSPLDEHFGHYRRYTRRELRGKLQQAGFRIERLHYFNFVGYLAWGFRFKLLRKMTFDIDQVRLFDRRIFPVANRIESSWVRPPIGQSLIAVASAS